MTQPTTQTEKQTDLLTMHLRNNIKTTPSDNKILNHPNM